MITNLFIYSAGVLACKSIRYVLGPLKERLALVIRAYAMVSLTTFGIWFFRGVTPFGSYTLWKTGFLPLIFAVFRLYNILRFRRECMMRV